MVDGLVRRHEPLPPVDQQHHPRQPLVDRRGPTLLLVRAETAVGKQPLPTLELAGEPGQEALAPRGLVPPHHRAAVRQGSHGCQPSTGPVEPVEVQVGDIEPLRQPGREGVQHGRPAASGAPDDEQVVARVEVEGDRAPALFGRQVDQPEGYPVRRHREPGEVVDRDDVRQRWQPGAGHGRRVQRGRRRATGADEPGQVRRPRRDRCLDHRRRITHPLPRSRPHRHRRRAGRLATHPRGLQGSGPPRPRPAARPVPAGRGRCRLRPGRRRRRSTRTRP